MKIHKKLKICLVDDGIDVAALRRLLPCLPLIHCHGPSSAIRPGPDRQAVTHGTICMGLLCEFLQRQHLLNAVELHSVSLVDLQGEQTVAMLEQALRRCFLHSIDLICLSAGFYRYLPAQRLIRLIRRQRHRILVAAQSNEGTVTYPASLPGVIGARYAPALPPGRLAFIRRPLDGIDVAAALPESKVLQALGYGAFTANSFTPPYVAAQLVAAWHKKRVPWALRDLKLFLARSSVSPPVLPAPFRRPSELPPVILFHSSGAGQKRLHLYVKKLQRLFLRDGYDCAVLDDSLCSQRIEAHRFYFPSAACREVLEHTVFLADPSILLVLAQGGTIAELLSKGIGNVLVTSRQILKVDAAAPLCAVKIAGPSRSPAALYLWLLHHFSET